jgi:two-component system response regulator PilR (NtrC family)
VDVRVLAATCRDLQALVREGKFRQDLYYRLEGMTIGLPPLRDRKDDIALLARRFLARMFGGPSAPRLHPLALERLRGYDWPGNVRQLQKVLCRAVGACRGSQVMAEDLDFGALDAAAAPAASPETPQSALRRLIAAAWGSQEADVWPLLEQQVQRELLQFALAQPGISQVKLARRLGMSRNYLRGLIKQYGLQEPAGGET